MGQSKHFFAPFKTGVILKTAALALLCGVAINAQAALCTQASSPNAAYTAIQPGRSTNLDAVNSVCWLNLPSLTNNTAQTLTYLMRDGSTVKLTVQKTAGQNLSPTTPSWTGAAMFNPGSGASFGSYWPDIGSSPVLYYSTFSTALTTVAITAVSVTNSSSAAVPFRMVVADGESTNGSETLSATINSTLSGGNGIWTQLDKVNSVSNSSTTGPTLSGASTATFTLTGSSTLNAGAYAMWTDRPRSVTVNLSSPSNGRQGFAVGIQMGSVVVNKTITPSRANTSDEFTYTASVNGLPVSQTTSPTNPGTTAAALGGLLPSDVVTVSETMAAGSSSTLSNYIQTFECKTSTGTTVAGTSMGHTLPYANLKIPTYGDNVNCIITNTAPTLKVVKSVLPSSDGGQFTYTLNSGYSGATNVTATGGNATSVSVVTGVGKSPTFKEAASGTTVLANYEASITSCTGDTSGNTVPFTGSPAAGGTVTINSMPAENVTCTLSNKRLPTVQVNKITTNGTGGPFTFTGTNGYSGDSLSTTTAGTATAGTAKLLAASSTQTEITEAAPPSPYQLTGITCTGLGTGGSATQDLANRKVTLNAAATAPGSNIVCTFTNAYQPKADLSVTKTGPAVVASGNTMTYALAVRNSNTVVGAVPVSAAMLKDVALAGAPYVSGSVTITCDTSVAGNVCTAGAIPTVAQLQSGYSIPVAIPVGGVYALSITATVN